MKLYKLCLNVILPDIMWKPVTKTYWKTDFKVLKWWQVVEWLIATLFEHHIPIWPFNSWCQNSQFTKFTTRTCSHKTSEEEVMSSSKEFFFLKGVIVRSNVFLKGILVLYFIDRNCELFLSLEQQPDRQWSRYKI